MWAPSSFGLLGVVPLHLSGEAPPGCTELGLDCSRRAAERRSGLRGTEILAVEEHDRGAHPGWEALQGGVPVDHRDARLPALTRRGLPRSGEPAELARPRPASL